MPKFQDLFRSPLLFASAIFVAVIILASFFGGAVAYFAQGGSVLLFNGFIAAAFFLALARLVRFLTVTLRKETSDALGSSPVARSIVAAGILLSSALVTAAVFG